MKKSQAQQLSLFDPPVSQTVGSAPFFDVTWSHSKRSTLEQCPRRYYYEYFGSKKRSALGEPYKQTLQFLDTLQNRHLRTGKILHLAISLWFRNARVGNRWDANKLIWWARQIFRKDRESSKASPEGIPPTGEKYPPVLLREYYYQLPNADELCQVAEDRLVAALDTFYHSPKLEAFRAGGLLEDAIIEKRFHLPSTACAIDGQIDLAYPLESRVKIVDWKLGADDDVGSDSLQLATYSLWAKDYYDCASDALDVFKVHLTSDMIVPFPADAEILANATARIAQDAQRLAVLQPYGEQADARAFTPCLRPGICRECPFERVCYA